MVGQQERFNFLTYNVAMEQLHQECDRRGHVCSRKYVGTTTAISYRNKYKVKDGIK